MSRAPAAAPAQAEAVQGEEHQGHAAGVRLGREADGAAEIKIALIPDS